MFARNAISRSVATYRRASSLSKLPAVGAFPIIGSTHKLFNIKLVDGSKGSFVNNRHDATYSWYKQFGPVYTIGLLGRKGLGWKNLSVVCADPEAYTKVLQNEGRNPIGTVQDVWILAGTMEEMDSKITQFFHEGEEWRRLRMATQKALMSPSKINGYMSGICHAAASASIGFERNQDQLDIFGYQCSFDVFCVVLYGRLMKAAVSETDIEHKSFCENLWWLIEELSAISLSPTEVVLYNAGYHTKRFSKWVKTFESTAAQCQVLITDFLKRRSQGKLDEFELQSYMASNLSRVEESMTSLTEQEFKDMTTFLLVFSMNTTSSILQWVLIYLAFYPEIQAKVRNEILSKVSQNGSPEELAGVMRKGIKKELPYLSSVIRETHRVRPAMVWTATKEPHCEVDLGGYKVSAGVPCTLDIFSIQNDPDIVDNPLEFFPDRWEESAVRARVGTKAEVLDHPLLKDPFSAGARNCPGYRVARIEVFAIIATLVRKYEFSLAPGQDIKTIYDIKTKSAATIIPKVMPKFVVKSLVS